MNDPEVTMLNAIPSTGLAAHRLALEAAGAAIKLVMRLPAQLKPIGDQVIRSASSVPANLRRVRFAKGGARHRRRRSENPFRFICGGAWHPLWCSRSKRYSHLRLLAATGAVSPSAAQNAMDGFDHVRAMTWRLLHPNT